jgi:Resolvase, N terminal domain
MSIRSSAVRQYCCYSKTPTEENGHALHPRRLYEDRATGRLDARAGLDGALKALRRGDTLIVWKLDRPGVEILYHGKARLWNEPVLGWLRRPSGI